MCIYIRIHYTIHISICFIYRSKYLVMMTHMWCTIHTWYMCSVASPYSLSLFLSFSYFSFDSFSCTTIRSHSKLNTLLVAQKKKNNSLYSWQAFHLITRSTKCYIFCLYLSISLKTEENYITNLKKMWIILTIWGKQFFSRKCLHSK